MTTSTLNINRQIEATEARMVEIVNTMIDKVGPAKTAAMLDTLTPREAVKVRIALMCHAPATWDTVKVHLTAMQGING